jgi:hypothetical protein
LCLSCRKITLIRTPASSTTKTGRHDIAEILLKVALNTKNQINQNYGIFVFLKVHIQ